MRADPVIAGVKTAVQALLGAACQRLLLHGARTRPGADAEAPYDFVAIVAGAFERTTEQRLAIALRPLEDAHRVRIACVLVPVQALERRTGFVWNLLSEALDI
ncbi:MAG: hypothetical protein IT561_11065 [Alphaproteobacteria bacterium]|nr:hypothetical protein [Alphaproteobacteria bacterium]